MRSMYSAVSGLRTHQTKMDVIGNNIANVNTIGFKKGQVTFQEVFSEIVQGAGAPQGGRGGTNPQQIGLGVTIGAINTIHTKGAEQTTNNPTDVMIDGEGFFVVTDDPNYNNRYYTRAGNLSIDGNGNLVTPDGYKVLGYTVADNGEITNTIRPLRINFSDTIGAQATDEIEFRGNLDARLQVEEEENFHIADTIIHDSLGNSYTVRFKIEKNATNNWEVAEVTVIDNATQEPIDGNVEFNNGNDFVLQFDSEGYLTSDANVNLNIIKDGVSFGTNGNINIDFSNLKQHANESSAEPVAVNGHTSGTLQRFSIDPSGVLMGVYTNGQRKALGQFILAKFDNPMGLEKLGSNFFIDTRNSGEPQIGLPGTTGLGAISGGSLEMSNVDLSMEFTEMITTQRGFQANSRVITTSDEMLQELVNMKR